VRAPGVADRPGVEVGKDRSHSGAAAGLRRLASLRLRDGSGGGAEPGPARTTSRAQDGDGRDPGPPPPGVLRLRVRADGIVAGTVAGSDAPSLALERGDDVVPGLDRVAPGMGSALRWCLESGSAASGTWSTSPGDGSAELLRFTVRILDGGDRHVDVERLRAVESRSPVSVHAAGVQASQVAAVRLLEAAGEDRPLRRSAADALEVLCSALDMEAAGFYAVREAGRAEVVAAFGRTRRRGFPYPQADLSERAFRSLPTDAPVLELGLGSGIETLVRSVVCPGARQVVLVPVPGEAGLLALLVLSRRRRATLDANGLWLLLLARRLLALLARNDALSIVSALSSTMLETAYTVSRAISRHLDVQETFRVIATNAARLVPGSRALVFELDERSRDLIAVASSEGDDAGVVGARFRFRGMSPEAALLERHVVLPVDDVVWDASVDEDVGRRFDTHALLFLPMFVENDPIGALALFGGPRRPAFSGRDIELAEEMVDQASVAIQNARLYSDLARSRTRIESLLAGMARVRELERQRLARVVHDDVIQSVVGALYQLETARRTLPEGSREKVEGPIEVLRSAVGEARAVISDLRPPVLDDVGLVGSLKTLAESTGRQTPARVGTILEEVAGLDDATAVALYRIAREALTNAVRHAGADVIYLTLEGRLGAHGRQAWMMVWDDGVGCDGESARSSDHYGWLMMEEQAALVGGVAKIVSIPGVGTTVETVVPVGQETRGGGADGG